MKYDDASWHYGGDFPAELPSEAGATHIGMFLAWCLLSGLGGEFHEQESATELESMKARQMTPGAFFVAACDEKLTDEDLNEAGNEFALAYYEAQAKLYYTDYAIVLGADFPSLYHVPDTWDSFDKLAPALIYRFEQWKTGQIAGDLPSTLYTS